MIPTRAQVKTRYLALLDDAIGAVFLDDPSGPPNNEAIFQAAFGEAYDALYTAFLNYQCPRIKLIATTILNPTVTSLVPADDWEDFADFDLLEERQNGSTDKFFPLTQWDILPQRGMFDRLLDFVWRNDTFYFIGATTQRELRVTYETSSHAPTDDGTSISVDGSLTFLAKYAAAVAGPRKGYDELAARYWADAVGPRYEEGAIGGELWRMISPRVREMQHVQLAPRPYSVMRRMGYINRAPYVAAQQPAGGTSMAPVQFTTNNGTITGAIDGLNAVFYLSYPVAVLDDLTVNGIRMTQGADYAFGANVITFFPSAIPTDPSAIITASGWL